MLVNSKFLRLLFGLTLFAMVATSCDDDDDNGNSNVTNPTLTQAATDAGLTTLNEAVTAAGLVSDLESAAEITVFAPNNTAFSNLLSALNVDNLDQLVTEIGGIENLEVVLGYHVVPAVAFANDLADGEQELTTLSGQSLTVTKSAAGVSVTDAAGNTFDVVTADVAIDNGVVHVIDGVLLPTLTLPTVVQAATDAGLSTLLDAVTAADLGDALTGAEAITVFGPTNDSFAQLLAEYGVSDLNGLIDRLGAATVSAVLQYHVVPSVAFSHDLSDGMMLETLQGEMLTVNVDGANVSLTDQDGLTYNVTAADVAIVNGVVHVIDGVVLPIDRPTVVTAATDAGLTTLLDAVTAAALGDALLGADAITVFAPTNDAFADLLAAQSVTTLEELIDKLGAEAVTDVLEFHVVPAVAYSGDLTDGAMFETLDGEMLTVNVSGTDVTVTDVNGNTFNVTTADVTIENGVVHVIDGVLLPTL
ncbi:fasciclin domain-containing protein [Fulvivirga lutea]|uniref:Fasciclin domain-containing protein n=2 Tax=Fulvivirga lutea TaxID=2810512 RepID=A0A975A2C3_9BACT|nr:fasciclin domain-containing protein [Fulvivirga lutea]